MPGARAALAGNAAAWGRAPVAQPRRLGRPLELYDRSVDTHVSNLRRKLALVPPVDPEIRGIRGAGYLLTQPGGA